MHMAADEQRHNAGKECGGTSCKTIEDASNQFAAASSLLVPPFVCAKCQGPVAFSDHIL